MTKYEPLKIKRLRERERSKALDDLYWSVEKCRRLFGYVMVESGSMENVPYPRMAIICKGNPPK